MFSVIIPLYNKAPYIEKAIRSVANQTCQDFELIIVDDGSTDEGFAIANHLLSELTSTLGGWKVIQQKNAGVSIARNNGVKHAVYDYIAFLDADDWWEISFLDEMKTLISLFPDSGIFGCSFYSIKHNEKRLVKSGLDDNFIGYADYVDLLIIKNSRPLCTGSNVFRKSAFCELGGYNDNFKFGEDFDLHLRLFLNYGLSYINKPLLNYNQDVDLNNRAVGGKLYSVSENAFFSLDRFISKSNTNINKLIILLKCRAFYPYYIRGIHLNEISLQLRELKFSIAGVGNFFRFKFISWRVLNIWYFVVLRFLKVVKQLLSPKHHPKKRFNNILLLMFI